MDAPAALGEVSGEPAAEPHAAEPAAAAWTPAELGAAHAAGGRAYHELLRVPALSAGLYVLPAGGRDPQQPHRQDEIYVVMRGRGRFTTVAGEGAAPEVRDVGPGDVIYVRRGIEHRFHDIAEELALVVVFAPAEG